MPTDYGEMEGDNEGDYVLYCDYQKMESKVNGKKNETLGKGK